MNRPGMGAVQAVGCLLIAVVLTVSAARAQGDAAKNYTAKCATCHGADGSANVPAGKALKARDFHSPDVQKESDDVLAQIIANGKNKMPAFGKQLSGPQIKALVAYIHQLGKTQ
jgi:mono/diheme cytochrome c family protein